MTMQLQHDNPRSIHSDDGLPHAIRDGEASLRRGRRSGRNHASSQLRDIEDRDTVYSTNIAQAIHDLAGTHFTYNSYTQNCEPVTDSPFSHLFDPLTMTIWDDPKSYKEMLTHPMAEYYAQAMFKERQSWEDNDAYEIVARSSIPIDPATGKPVHSVMRCTPVWKTKLNPDNTINKFKYRLCVNGSRQDKSKELCYESMVSMPSMRAVVDLAVRFNMDIVTTDASCFYLQMPVREGEIYYMELPEGWTTYDRRKYVMRLKKAVYGIPSAGQTAGNILTAALKREGFQPCIHDTKVYVKWHDDSNVSICMVHVALDDSMWCTTDMSKLQQTLDILVPEFQLTSDYDPKIFRGIELRRSSDANGAAITLHQGGYLAALPEKLGLVDRRCRSTPAEDNSKFETLQHYEPSRAVQASIKQISRYMQIQGCMQWAVITNPSCNFAINYLSRHMRNPQPRHVALQERCLLYICSLQDTGITFRREGPPEPLSRGYLMDDIVGWADATWGDCKTSGVSTSGYCYTTKQGTVLYAVARQNNVTNSTCESEVMANRTCALNGIWLRRLYQDMGFQFSKPTRIMQDNQSAIAVCKTDAHHARSRHFRIACAFLKELYDHRVFIFEWVQSERMVADVLTKALPVGPHAAHEQTLTRKNRM
jgi:hypothetical protein